MPTYEYECSACGHVFDIFQPITQDALKECPECKRMTLQRLIGAGAGVIFKGSGFYQTDYRSEGYKKRAAEDSSSAKGNSCSSCAESNSCSAKKE